MRFRLIRALIETLRSFRKIKNLKIVVALRTDVLERAIQENADAGFQREKFKDLIIDIRWTRQQLKSLINKRISKQFYWQYTKENVTFEHVFADKVGRSATFDYLADRTLLRPRDILEFVNICLEKAEGSALVSAKHVTAAESRYSSDRLDALTDEWRVAFPSLRTAIDFFSGGAEVREFADISGREIVEQLALPIGANPDSDLDPLARHAHAVINPKSPPLSATLSFAREIVAILYRVGAVGVKLSPTERYVYAFSDATSLTASALPETFKLRFHQMLHRAMGIASVPDPHRRGAASDAGAST